MDIVIANLINVQQILTLFGLRALFMLLYIMVWYMYGIVWYVKIGNKYDVLVSWTLPFH